MKKLNNHKLRKQWIKNTINILNQDNKYIQYTYEIQEDIKNTTFEFIIYKFNQLNSKKTKYYITKQFFYTIEYQQIKNIHIEWKNIKKNNNYLKRNNKIKFITELQSITNWLVKHAQKKIYIQRYKGLGEMNPKQLWETTMNPKTRNMLQVTIKDSIKADKLFNVLMGDSVEPRKKFIENYALTNKYFKKI